MEENKTISQEELEQWIQRAEGGDCEMLYLLGEYYYTGTKKDYRRALAYYLQAAEAGHILAQRRAGEMYMSGKKIGKNVDEAIKWYTLAAEQGDIVAHYQLGECYWLGKKQDKNRAFDHYFAAAKGGCSLAQETIEKICLHSKGINNERLNKALKWLKVIAEQGNTEMQYKLGVIYSLGNIKDFTHAHEYYKMAAETGYAPAQYELGKMYALKNHDEAKKWLTLAAEQGEKRASHNLAALYYYKENNKEKSLYWATHAGADTLYQLGEEFLIHKDIENSELFFNRAAADEHDYISLIAYIYETNGYIQKAFEWLMRGVEEGVDDAAFEIGRMYEEGSGVDKDISQAIHWYTLSAEQGYEDAIEALERLTKSD